MPFPKLPAIGLIDLLRGWPQERQHLLLRFAKSYLRILFRAGFMAGDNDIAMLHNGTGRQDQQGHEHQRETGSELKYRMRFGRHGKNDGGELADCGIHHILQLNAEIVDRGQIFGGGSSIAPHEGVSGVLQRHLPLDHDVFHRRVFNARQQSI